MNLERSTAAVISPEQARITFGVLIAINRLQQLLCRRQRSRFCAEEKLPGSLMGLLEAS